VTELKNQLDEVRAAIANEQGRVREKIKQEYLAAVQREGLLTGAFEKQKQDANQLNESGIEYTALKRDSELNRQLYQNLLQRLKEAGVTAGLKSSNLRIVDVAQVPLGPFKPNPQRNVAFGFLMGLAGGNALAFVMESMDSTIRD